MKLSLVQFLSVAAVCLPIVAAGCGSGDGMMTGPGATARGNTMLISVAPVGGTPGVPTGSSMAARFSATMAPGMEAFMDLHEGGLDGHVVPMRCEFSSNRSILTCAPGAPLRPGMAHTLHIGGGMMDSDNHSIDMDTYRGTMGGQWILGSMMGTSHDGSPWGMMGGNWRGTNGGYGMAFPFTTG